MAIGKFLKGIAKDLKKGAKGSKEHQAEKAKKDKGKGGKNWYPGKYAKKAAKSVAKDIKKGLKGSKEYQAEKAKKKAVKAKKKEGKTWTKAVKKQKKAGGSSMSNLIKRRNAAKKGSEAYAKAQNAINEAYGSKKVHKADAPKKADKKKVAPKGPPGPGRDAIDYGQDIKITKSPGQKFEKGGKVEGNPYGWPTKDSRNR